MKKYYVMACLAALLLALVSTAGCANKSYYEMIYPTDVASEPLPEGLPDVGNIHTYKAPLYWTVYEYMITNQMAGTEPIMNMDEWVETLDWIKLNLLPYGYDSV